MSKEQVYNYDESGHEPAQRMKRLETALSRAEGSIVVGPIDVQAIKRDCIYTAKDVVFGASTTFNMFTIVRVENDK